MTSGSQLLLIFQFPGGFAVRIWMWPLAQNPTLGGWMAPPVRTWPHCTDL